MDEDMTDHLSEDLPVVKRLGDYTVEQVPDEESAALLERYKRPGCAATGRRLAGRSGGHRIWQHVTADGCADAGGVAGRRRLSLNTPGCDEPEGQGRLECLRCKPKATGTKCRKSAPPCLVPVAPLLRYAEGPGTHLNA